MTTAMVCQRDPENRAQITSALRARRFEVVEVGHPDRAFRHLDAEAAVVDWQAGRSASLLKELARRPEIVTFVFDPDLDEGSVAAIGRIGGADLHHPAWGISSLADRIVTESCKSVGDLTLRGESVECRGSACKNRVAVRLIAAYPKPLYLPDKCDPEVVSRFRRWLSEVGSSWTVVCVRRASLYRLVEVRERAA
jgi:hypothetical protein